MLEIKYNSVNFASMNFLYKKYILTVLSVLITLFIFSSCRSKGAYNPYLEKKAKTDKREIKANKKALSDGNKAYKKQLQSNRKYLFGRKTAP
jgi:hypothetical protein